MAITRTGQFIRLTSQSDVITDKLQVQAIYAKGDDLQITDKDGTVLFELTERQGSCCEPLVIEFPCKIEFNGLSFVGAQGNVTAFLS